LVLIDLDPDRLDDGAPFIDFRFEESLKLIGRRAHHHIAGLFQLALDHGIAESRDVSTLIFLTISGGVCGVLPVPGDASVSLPGCAFA